MADAIRFLAIDAIVRAGDGHPGVPLGMRRDRHRAVHPRT